MAFIFTHKETIFVLYGDNIIISESCQEPKVLRNPELKPVALKTDNHESQPEEKEEQEKCSPDISTQRQSDEQPDSPECVLSQQEQPKDKECEEQLLEGSVKPLDSKQPLTSETGAVCCCLSVCGRLLAVADHAKRLIVWQCSEDQEWQVISCRPTKRKCISVRFCPSSQVVLAADRAGDVYSFSVSSPLEPEKLLLGHLSMLLDMLISNDGRFVITSDRDEKIRVSHYPNTYNIQSYCLGHTEFVSALSLCTSHSDWLLSGSGDGTLRLWDYKSGEELFSHSYKSDIQPVLDSKDGNEQDKRRVPAVAQIETSQGSDVVALLFDKIPCVGLYQLNTSSGSPEITHVQLITIAAEPWDIKLNTGGTHLFVISPGDDVLTVLRASDDKLEFKELPESGMSPAMTRIKSFLSNRWETLKDCKKRDDFQHLYKQWFDNMKTYLEKKELRVKNKNDKCKKFKKLNSVK